MCISMVGCVYRSVHVGRVPVRGCVFACVSLKIF